MSTHTDRQLKCNQPDINIAILLKDTQEYNNTYQQMWNLTTEQLSLQSGQAVLQCVCLIMHAQN